MSNEITISLELPVTRINVTGDYVEKKPASGLEYMLLKLIEFGNKTSVDMTISDIMGIASIAEDLLPLILGELEELLKKKMITTDLKARLKGDTKVKKLVITEDAENVLKDGFVTQKNSTYSKTLLYYPARKPRFANNRDVDESRPMMRKAPAPEEVVEFIDGNKPQFGMSLDAERTKAPKVEVDRTFKYDQPLRLYFNIDEGCFEINEVASGVDLQYIYKHVNGDKILKDIPKEKFVLSEHVPFKPKWNSELPGCECQSILPGEFIMPHGFVLYNDAKTSRPDVPVTAKMPDEIGCDIAVITHPYEGYKYWFVEKDAPLKGFSGLKRSERMVVCHRMTADEIRKSVRSALAGLEMNRTADLETMNSIARAMQDPSVFANRIREEIADWDSETLGKVLTNINKLTSKIWKSELEDVLENNLCRLIENGMDMSAVAEYYDICQRRGYSFEGSALIEKLLSNGNVLDVSDWIISNELGKERVLGRSDLAASAMAAVAENGELPKKSEFFKQLCQARDAYASVKELSGIGDCAKYSFDIGRISEENGKEIARNWTVFNNTMEKILQACPGAAQTAAFGRMEKEKDTYAVVAEAVSAKRSLAKRRDLINEENPLLFARSLVGTLDNLLLQLIGTRKHGASQIEEARKKGALSASDAASVNEFVEYADKTVVRDVTCRLDKSIREEMVNAVYKLAEI